MPPASLRRRLALALAVALLVAGAGIAYVVWPRGATPVTVEDAVTRFRESTGYTSSPTSTEPTPDAATDDTAPSGPAGPTGDAPGDGAPREGDPGGGGTVEGSAPGGNPGDGDGGSTAPPTTTEGQPPDPAPPTPALPRPGVYVHDASGSERVQLALFSERRSFPAQVPVTVTHPEAAGCFTVTVDLIEQHSEDTTYCATPEGGLRLAGHRKRQSLGAMRPTASMGCRPDVLYGPGQERHELRCELKISNGPARQKATLTGTARTTNEVVKVGNTPVEALRVELGYTVKGDMSGSWKETLWLARDSWLPLRIERDLDLRGFATFREQSSLALRSTEPVR